MNARDTTSLYIVEPPGISSYFATGGGFSDVVVSVSSSFDGIFSASSNDVFSSSSNSVFSASCGGVLNSFATSCRKQVYNGRFRDDFRLQCETE